MKRSFLFVIIGTATLLLSCGKTYDVNGFDWQPDTPLSDSVFNREIQVLDLGTNNIPEGHRPLDGADPLYFSLEKFSSTHLAYKSTARWDIAFSGLYRSSVTANNGSKQGFGYGSSAIGGIMLIDSAYNEVTTIPDDNQFQVPGEIGLGGFDASPMPGGHIFYTFFGNIFRPDKLSGPDGNLYMHMMYCMSEDFARLFPGQYGPEKVTIKPHTFIIRTANGNYAKLETQSYYKGVMDPMDMYRSTSRPIPYISFHYMVVKAAEKRFGFVKRKPKLTIDMTRKRTTTGR